MADILCDTRLKSEEAPKVIILNSWGCRWTGFSYDS